MGGNETEIDFVSVGKNKKSAKEGKAIFWEDEEERTEE